MGVGVGPYVAVGVDAGVGEGVGVDPDVGVGVCPDVGVGVEESVGNGVLLGQTVTFLQLWVLAARAVWFGWPPRNTPSPAADATTTARSDAPMRARAARGLRKLRVIRPPVPPAIPAERSESVHHATAKCGEAGRRPHAGGLGFSRTRHGSACCFQKLSAVTQIRNAGNSSVVSLLHPTILQRPGGSNERPCSRW